MCCTSWSKTVASSMEGCNASLALRHTLLGIARLYLPLWARYSKTAHSFNTLLGSSVTITNPIHPLYGQSVVVRQMSKVGKTMKITVEHPDGGLLSLPAEETTLSLPEAGVMRADTTRLFDPEKLLRLSEWVAARSKPVLEKFSCVPEDEEAEHKKTNDTTKAKKARSTGKKRRTYATPNQTDSTAGGQNALKTQPIRCSDQE